MQAFYLVSRFHDHLESARIGFDAASGNFEKADGDAVLTQTLDGALDRPVPMSAHRNNANMSTPPDGLAPTMQMYLFRDTGSATALDFRSINGGDDSGVVWHEYTHGLSNRLVTNADGRAPSAAPTPARWARAGATGTRRTCRSATGSRPTPPGRPVEIDIGDYTDADLAQAAQPGARLPGQHGGSAHAPAARTPRAAAIRSATSARSSAPRRCTPTARSGPRRCGTCARRSAPTSPRRLVTNGMRLSPPEPSMLDMRNSILAAEQANGGGLHDEVWEVFRMRGMGYCAAVSDGADTEPVEDFTLPPDPAGPKGTTTGVVTDSDSGLPLAGVRVGFGGHASRPDFDDYLADETDATGRYTIPDVPVGSYPKLAFFASAGYDTVVVRDVSVAAERDDDARHPHDARLGRAERRRRPR